MHVHDATILLFCWLLLSAPTTHGWLAPQTRREMMGWTWWKALSTTMTLVDPTPPPQVPATTASGTTEPVKVPNNKEQQQQHDEDKKQQRERERIARETKARLAAGRIGII